MQIKAEQGIGAKAYSSTSSADSDATTQRCAESGGSAAASTGSRGKACYTPARGGTMAQRRSIGRWVVILGGCFSTCACSSPLAGGWQGTADLGPTAAYDVTLQLNEEATAGTIAIHEDGKAFEKYTICSLHLDQRSLALSYDANRPNCDDKSPDPSDRRTLRGTVGEGVVYGEVFAGDDKAPQRLGFFRAFRKTP
jgi:hypothetical protein